MPRSVAKTSARTRTSTLTRGAILAGLLAVTVALGNAAVRRPSTPPVSSKSDAARERYDTLYQSAFRSDGGRGAVTADAVFEYPALVEALAAYVQRGFTQNQTLDVLTNARANNGTFAFVLTTAVGTTDPTLNTTVANFDFPTHARLSDDKGRTYAVGTWHELAPVKDPARIGVLTFEQSVDGKTTAAAGATTLTLTLSDLPGGTRSYAWDLTVLQLPTP